MYYRNSFYFIGEIRSSICYNVGVILFRFDVYLKISVWGYVYEQILLVVYKI